VTVGEHVAADVEEDDEVAVEPIGGLGDPVGHGARTGVHVHEHGRLAEQAGHARLAEHHASRAHARVRAREEHARRQRLGVLDLAHGTRAGLRVDRLALPRDAAHDRMGAVIEPRRLRRRQRAHDVPAAADSDHERPARLRQDRVGVHQRGQARSICTPCSATSSDRRPELEDDVCAHRSRTR
jgi:hypothetical protein